MSKIRKTYFARLVCRVLILIACLILCFASPKSFDILNGFNFFKKFSIFHLLWVVWVFDMVLQIIPLKSTVALGSQKLFAHRFKPIRDKINKVHLKEHILSISKSAYLVMIIWTLFTAIIGALYFFDVIGKIGLFIITVLFYVCDLICVLVWCPFRLIMRNKCCTTCRIFNWDHLMMFSPIVFMGGFFSLSLFGMAFLAWGVWELCILIYPERFAEMSNAALKCSQCTDKLCTQYCQKLRK